MNNVIEIGKIQEFLVLLLIAYFNLIGFTFSKGKRHQLQITIKRCLGASKTKLISAFIIENLLYTSISLIASLFIIFEIWSNKPPILAYLNTISLSKFILPVAILAIFASVIAIISGSFAARHIPQTKVYKTTVNSSFA